MGEISHYHKFLLEGWREKEKKRDRKRGREGQAETHREKQNFPESLKGPKLVLPLESHEKLLESADAWTVPRQL